MAYHVVDPTDLDTAPDRPSAMRDIAEAAGLHNLGLRVYEVQPGEDVPISGMHYHDEQEEVFYVLEGTLSVETPGDGYRVGPGQFFVAEPESPHRAHNASDALLRVIGIGAPAVEDGHAYDV